MPALFVELVVGMITLGAIALGSLHMADIAYRRKYPDRKN